MSDDALQSVRQVLAHQKRMHDDATTRLRTRIHDLQAQVQKLVGTLERKCATDTDLGAVHTRMRLATKTLLSLARKPPTRGSRVPDVL